MMGAGKSTVGRLLAEWLSCGAVDTDDLVERRNAMTVAELFAAEGEPAFRANEAAVLAEVGKTRGPMVVSVGGGGVLNAKSRAAMRSIGTVIWLRARPTTLALRVGTGASRPLLGVGGEGTLDALERLDAERRALYEEVADVVVDVDDLSSQEAARMIVTRLADRLRF